MLGNSSVRTIVNDITSIPISIVDETSYASPVLKDYKTIIVFFSGGKDSVACVLHLLESGVPANKIELHHHCVDGREGSTLFDWPVTEDYCRKFAKSFGIPIYFSWKTGGFEREMLRENALTAPIKFETPDGEIHSVGGTRGKLNTRRKFPQVTADLKTRWCSAYLKIDVGSALIRNQERFADGNMYLAITGERAEESSSRARYKTFEPDRSDNRDGKRVKRHVDHWRPVHKWDEAKVWDILQRHGVVPHASYQLGWGRMSCMSCIFGSKNQWATISKFFPSNFDSIAIYESEFGFTIQRKLSIRELASLGTPYNCDPKWVLIADQEEYKEPIRVNPVNWLLPAGAFGESNGPT